MGIQQNQILIDSFILGKSLNWGITNYTPQNI